MELDEGTKVIAIPPPERVAVVLRGSTMTVVGKGSCETFLVETGAAPEGDAELVHLRVTGERFVLASGPQEEMRSAFKRMAVDFAATCIPKPSAGGTFLTVGAAMLSGLLVGYLYHGSTNPPLDPVEMLKACPARAAAPPVRAEPYLWTPQTGEPPRTILRPPSEADGD